MMADLYAATVDDPGQAQATWSSVMCTLLFLEIIGNVLGGDASREFVTNGNIVLGIIRIIGNIFQIIFAVYVTVIFGKAATRLGKKTGVEYEPGKCFEDCCSEDGSCCGGCCSNGCGCMCCLTYCCCAECHLLQVARNLEEHPEMTTTIDNNRPNKCKCCNCWIQAGNSGTTMGNQAL